MAARSLGGRPDWRKESIMPEESESLKPVEVGRANEYDVKIRWKDGREAVYPAKFLRFHCPCAVCVDELTGERKITEGALPDGVHPVAIQPVGHYAIQIYFSDGHSTGIYTWERLRDLISELPANPAHGSH